MSTAECLLAWAIVVAVVVLAAGVWIETRGKR